MLKAGNVEKGMVSGGMEHGMTSPFLSFRFSPSEAIGRLFGKGMLDKAQEISILPKWESFHLKNKPSELL